MNWIGRYQRKVIDAPRRAVPAQLQRQLGHLKTSLVTSAVPRHIARPWMMMQEWGAQFTEFRAQDSQGFSHNLFRWSLLRAQRKLITVLNKIQKNSQLSPLHASIFEHLSQLNDFITDVLRDEVTYGECLILSRLIAELIDQWIELSRNNSNHLLVSNYLNQALRDLAESDVNDLMKRYAIYTQPFSLFYVVPHDISQMTYVRLLGMPIYPIQLLMQASYTDGREFMPGMFFSHDMDHSGFMSQAYGLASYLKSDVSMGSFKKPIDVVTDELRIRYYDQVIKNLEMNQLFQSWIASLPHRERPFAVCLVFYFLHEMNEGFSVVDKQQLLQLLDYYLDGRVSQIEFYLHKFQLFDHQDHAREMLNQDWITPTLKSLKSFLEQVTISQL